MKTNKLKIEIFAWIIVTIFFLGLTFIFIPVANGTAPEAETPTEEKHTSYNYNEVRLVKFTEYDLKMRILNQQVQVSINQPLNLEGVAPLNEKRDFTLIRKDIRNITEFIWRAL